jgi:hypothetical protein
VRVSTGLSWRRAAGSDAAHGLQEDAEVADAILEQVAHAGGVVADQVERVPGLEELREHEHADRGLLLADRLGGADAVIGRVGRHLDVGHDDVGLVRARLAQEIRGVGGDAGHLVAAFLEHADDALAHERLVLSDDDPDGDHQSFPQQGP